MSFSIKKNKKERGQAIVLVAMALVGLIAILGLMVDVGTLFLEASNVKRAIDAAAVAASLEFREGVTLTPTTNTPVFLYAAQEFILLNEGEAYDIETYICDVTERDTNPNYEHADLCEDPNDPDDFQRKLIRVRGTKDVKFSFLPIIGIDGTTITSDSVGEAASVDVVLVIDASMSMADETDGVPGPTGIGDDPAACNAADDCQPFRDIKDVAIEFTDQLLYPYDRVSIVTFDRLPHNATITQATHDGGWQNEKLQVQTTVNSIGVYQPEVCDEPNPPVGNCLNYYTNATGDPDLSIGCMYPLSSEHPGNPTSCTSSNIGGGLQLANYQFTQKERVEALWVVVLLAGGPANAISPTNAYPDGYCGPNYWNSPACRDDRASVRHPNNSTDYDGDDFARDIADQLVGADGLGAVIYSIGLGEKVRNDTRHRSASYDPDIAEILLTYIATEAGVPNQGIYYYAEDASGLAEIFRQIAENIATKIAQ